jgi:hypothetical protein
MFLHRLALALGKTVSELSRECTAPELAEWAAYFEVAPPEFGDDQRTAMICSTMARLKGQRIKAKDFMPRRRQIRHRQTRAEQIAMFKAVT